MLKVRVYNAVILPKMFCMGVKCGLLSKGRNINYKSFENKLLRKIFGTYNDELDSSEYNIMRKFMIYTYHLVLL
jgi:hypothetical protein